MEHDAFASENHRLQQALNVLRDEVPFEPETALVLGSGLGELAELAEDAVTVPAAALPGYPESTVAGHHGRLVFGRLDGHPVVFVQGRLHYYEGHPVQSLAFPIRLVHAAGAERLIVTNAAGGINPLFEPGTLMFIVDHLNLAFPGALVGSSAPGEEQHLLRRPNPCYDREWIRRAEKVAVEQGRVTRQGVYAWVSGPSYETKAEIEAFAQLGADAIGMSTVPEVIQARRLGMRVLGLSTITNPAAGLSTEPLSHEEVLETGRRVRGDLKRLVRGIVRET